METTIEKVGPVEYELRITAAPDDLANDFDSALRTYRKQVSMKGFRPGKVPLGLLKKMHGKAIGYEVSEKVVEEAYQDLVLQNDEYEVLGRPLITELEFDLDDGMQAVVSFGVRPEFELADVSEEEIDVLAYEVTDEDVDEELEELRKRNADMVPHEEEISETDFVVVDLQRIDEATNTPIVGEKEEGQEFFLDNPYLHEELKDALVGKKVGDSVRVTLPHPPEEGQHGGSEEDGHTHHYEVTVQETKRRELPELDDAFIGEITEDEFISVDELRQEIRDQLERFWKQRADSILRSNVIERMLELHSIPVSRSVVEVFLDSFQEQLKQEHDGELPPDFDEAAFREANRTDAEEQARWMIIRDKIVEERGLEVTDEDLDAYLEEQAQQNDMFTVEQLRRFYESMPKLMEQSRQKLLSDKVFDLLGQEFERNEKDAETLEQEHQERQQRMAEIAAPSL